MQAAVYGVRQAGALEQLILVEGTSWTGAWSTSCILPLGRRVSHDRRSYSMDQLVWQWRCLLEDPRPIRQHGHPYVLQVAPNHKARDADVGLFA